MRTLLALAVSLSLCSVGMVGCNKSETGMKETKTTTTDGGSKTTTTSVDTTTKGENPPK
jgi:hypothetical protein